MSYKTPFQISLSAARVNAELKQRQLADLMGVNVGTIVNWEKGRTFPNVDQVNKLSEILGIPYDYLRFGKPATLKRKQPVLQESAS